jgi:hypothetical protein
MDKDREMTPTEREPSPATRQDGGEDAPPPLMTPVRGPMDQITPDVPTGSTPLTRQDD